MTFSAQVFIYSILFVHYLNPVLLNAIANNLRYPNSHTVFYSTMLLHLFSVSQSEAIQEQIARYDTVRLDVILCSIQLIFVQFIMLQGSFGEVNCPQAAPLGFVDHVCRTH